MIFDTGLYAVDEAGSNLSMATITCGWQHVFGAGKRTAPFADASLGVYHESSAAQSSTEATCGAGIGLRRAVAEDHGDLRCEIRVDYLRAEPNMLRPALTTCGLRLGFDLWI